MLLKDIIRVLDLDISCAIEIYLHDKLIFNLLHTQLAYIRNHTAIFSEILNLYVVKFNTRIEVGYNVYQIYLD